jgi:hypothetical protein
MKPLTLIQAGALLFLAVYGAYTHTPPVPQCAQAEMNADSAACEL